MLIVALNIRSGGASRTDALLEYLAALEPTTVVITEWRSGLHGRKFETWARAREMEFYTCNDGMTPNGVFIASRQMFSAKSRRPVQHSAGILLEAQFPNFVMLGCYFPQREAKRPFFDQCSDIAREHADRPFLLLGDLNTGNQTADRDKTGAPYHCAEAFDNLAKHQGLCDLWRHQAGAAARQWSWLSSVGNGFRIDHAFANAAFMDWAAPHCEYDHTPRLERHTDHSAIVVRCEVS